MSDPRTALAGASFDGLISLRDAGPQGMITLRGDLGDPAVKAALSAVCDVDHVPLRGVVRTGDRSLLWMSPDEVLILCPYAEVQNALQEIREALGEVHGLAVDVSDARALFHLTGPAVREVLAKITPADMRPGSLPVGELRRSRLAQVAGAFWFSDEETAHVICFRSVAGYVFELLSTSAAPGSAPGYFS